MIVWVVSCSVRAWLADHFCASSQGPLFLPLGDTHCLQFISNMNSCPEANVEYGPHRVMPSSGEPVGIEQSPLLAGRAGWSATGRGPSCTGGARSAVKVPGWLLWTTSSGMKESWLHLSET